MRLTGGELAGRRLEVPKGPWIRPTQDQVRQALFNILGNRVEGAKVLDLFAGSGALGIEALSRGAVEATFVEQSGHGVAAIEENLKNLGLKAKVIRSDAEAAIKDFASKGKRFDLILMDPPYRRDLARKILLALGRYAIVSSNGLVVAEAEKRASSLPREVEAQGTRLVMQRIENYGDTALGFYLPA